jgi:CubicO group peptidase (beta-lactamase class C family)
MTGLQDFLQAQVDAATVPGAVALVARGDQVDVAVAGFHDLECTVPMARDSIFRIASISKPIVAAAAMVLVEDGLMALEDPVSRWLPELAAPDVLRRPDGPEDDVVPAVRPITVRDVLDSRAGYGFPSDFSWPAVRSLLYLQPGPRPDLLPAPDAWLGRLAGLPLLDQPGEAWLYNTCYDLLGVLIARVAGSSLPEFLAERLFEPLGMPDTGFCVPAGKLHRLPACYQEGESGLEPVSVTAEQWSRPPAFPSGAGGLVSTVDDWFAFARMLLADGTAGGRQVLSPASVRLITTDQLTRAQREAGRLFLEGQGWGFGGSVDVEPLDPWNVPGRYGWVGGTGTAAHVTAATGTVTILLSQRMMTSPTPPELMRRFWRYAATA